MQAAVVAEKAAKSIADMQNGLKVLDHSVENFASGAWQALGSAWKGGSNLVQKLEHSAVNLAESIQHGSIPGGAGAPSLLETGKSFTAKGMQVLEYVGKETMDLLITETGIEVEKNPKGSEREADEDQLNEEVTFDRCFYIYGVQNNGGRRFDGDIVNIDWPEDSVEKAKVIRTKAQSMAGYVEAVCDGFVTGISDVAEAYVAAMKSATADSHDNLPKTSIQEKANTLSELIRTDRTTAFQMVSRSTEWERASVGGSGVEYLACDWALLKLPSSPSNPSRHCSSGCRKISGVLKMEAVLKDVVFGILGAVVWTMGGGLAVWTGCC
ncbi:hypothetical protein GH714_008312 [Hevea brasiliensis]|uniref:DUF7798 domain-containing protein n=1 Tax=Hevea brasiliensis TaxID=3981 RepID=A0A6A6M1N0_HEVBR|nr:hypothetical protein GH714_008312 [Hevea brasiliensis]